MSKNRVLQDLQAGTYGSGGELLDWSYYDTATLVSTTLTHRLFTIPLGGGTPQKTLNVTNMTAGGQIPQGQNFTVHALKILYTTATAFATADVQSFYSMLKNTTVEIILPGKDSMGTWVLQELLGLSVAAAVIPTVGGDNLDFATPRYHGVFPLNIPLVLAALTPFELRVIHHVAAAAALDNDRLQITLSGKLRRSS